MSKTREERRKEKYASTRGAMISIAAFLAALAFFLMSANQAMALAAW